MNDEAAKRSHRPPNVQACVPVDRVIFLVGRLLPDLCSHCRGAECPELGVVDDDLAARVKDWDTPLIGDRDQHSLWNGVPRGLPSANRRKRAKLGTPPRNGDIGDDADENRRGDFPSPFHVVILGDTSSA